MPASAAFSLVELSIVLVILGLLVGTVLTSQSMVRAAELRSVSTEYNKFSTAVQSFRDRYFSLPGDMTNATSVWGAADPTAATCTTTVGSGTQTCDGNGDGKLYFSGLYTNPTTNEIFRFWQHLANAGLIEGSYTGVTSSPTGYFFGVGPLNTPAGRIRNARWSVTYGNNLSGTFSSNWFTYEYTPYVFVYGAINGTSWNSSKVMSADEAWNIDSKIDDGLPGLGKVLATVGSNCNNAASQSDFTTTYSLTQAGINCTVLIRP